MSTYGRGTTYQIEVNQASQKKRNNILSDTEECSRKRVKKVGGEGNFDRADNQIESGKASQSQGLCHGHIQSLGPTTERETPLPERTSQATERATYPREPRNWHRNMSISQALCPFEYEASPSLTPSRIDLRRKKITKPAWPWTDDLVELMLNTLVDQKNRGNQNGGKWRSGAWAACKIAINRTLIDPAVRPCDQEILSSKWQTLKKLWSAYCLHYGVESVGHCLGWQPNFTTKGNITFEFPDIEPGVLVCSEYEMAAHYARFKECAPFKKKLPRYMGLLELLLGNRPANDSHAVTNNNVQDDLDSPSHHPPHVSSALPCASASSSPSVIREIKRSMRKNIITNSSLKTTVETTMLNLLPSAVQRPMLPIESYASLAMKKAENLERFKENDEILWNLNELFFANERKAEQFLSLPEVLIGRWMAKEFGDNK